MVAGHEGARSHQFSDLAFPCLAVATLWCIHFAFGNGYGFHRDELQFLYDARHMRLGYVAYPPITAFVGRLGIALLGVSASSLRLPAVLGNSVTVVLASLLSRTIGGNRFSQALTVLAVLPVAVVYSSVLQYNTFDLLAWTVMAYYTARVLASGEQKYWLGVGVGIGFGVLAKYSIAFPAASLFVALFALPSQRHHLRTRWFWYGMTVAIMMALPNLLWLATHHFITLQMEHFIHLRDVHEGRADSYYGDQLRFTLFAFPLALGGLIWLLRSSRFRLLACFWIGPFLLFALAKGRGYYLIPAYTVLYAAGAVAFQSLCSKAKGWAFLLNFLLVIALLTDVAIVSYMRLPLWREGSSRWVAQVSSNSDLADEVGWPEFVTQVSKEYDSLNPADREHARIVANNYGEAGALDLYGPAHQLPPVMSRTNSFFYQTFPSEVSPDVVIITGSSLAHEQTNFAVCTVVNTVRMPFGVMNEESAEHPEILVCRHPLRPWQQLWGPKPQFG